MDYEAGAGDAGEGSVLADGERGCLLTGRTGNGEIRPRICCFGEGDIGEGDSVDDFNASIDT